MGWDGAAVLQQDEIKIKMDDIHQALALEKRHRYVDVQGRRKRFSQYIQESLKEIAAWRLADGDALSSLKRKFLRYGAMDMPQRISAHDELEAFITEFWTQRTGARPKTVTAVAAKSSADTEFASTSEIEGTPSPSTQAISEQPVSMVHGVGPRMEKLLVQVGVQTVEDLLYYFPRRYIDYQRRVPIAKLEEGLDVSVIATVVNVHVYATKSKSLCIAKLTVQDSTGRLAAQWFFPKKNQHTILSQWKSKYPPGTEVLLSGRVKWDRFSRSNSMDRPQVEILNYQGGDEPSGSADSIHAGRIVPVYGLIEGLNLFSLRRAIFQTLDMTRPQLIDPMPEPIAQRYKLLDLPTALQQIHFPDAMEMAEVARRRLVFDELFYLQARLALIRTQYKGSVEGLSLKRQSGSYVDRFMAMLPFQLTGAQQRVFEEITQDLESTEPMYRLLHGDVGSGKTIIAALTLLMAVENGYQGALMAPTEILAEQHYQKFTQWFTALGLKVGLFVGKHTGTERKARLNDLYNGQIHIAIGTHALIQDGIEFHCLGVVVIDEQHRFGVRQRMQLKSKGEHPEMLTMTATPIPRTMALTVHGDLDVSKIDELPPGRSPIQTVLLPPSKHKQAESLIRQEVTRGRQIYIVFPLIDESESLAAKAATTEYERLQKEVFPEFRIGLLHGKLRSEEKERVMGDFAKHQLDILVATTVVEVGVDVPNATVMVIENADRFGLAQLHQLRGRVGRGAHQSYCLLMSSTKTPETLERLNVMVETQDGFIIAQRDLEIRGPGEFLGTRQSGLPDLALADLIKDQAILEEAREAAFEVINEPHYFVEYPALRAMIDHKTENTVQVLGSG